MTPVYPRIEALSRRGRAFLGSELGIVSTMLVGLSDS